MKNSLRLISAIILLGMIKSVYAVCPLCTIAAGVGVGCSRYFGIDDTITGIWIGGIILSSALWFAHFLRSKNIKFTRTISIAVFYSMTLLPLYWMNFFGLEENTLWHVDKLLLGIIIGSFVFLFGVFIDLVLRATNECKVYFYFQRVILPIACLVTTSLLFYYFIC